MPRERAHRTWWETHAVIVKIPWEPLCITVEKKFLQEILIITGKIKNLVNHLLCCKACTSQGVKEKAEGWKQALKEDDSLKKLSKAAENGSTTSIGSSRSQTPHTEVSGSRTQKCSHPVIGSGSGSAPIIVHASDEESTNIRSDKQWKLQSHFEVIRVQHVPFDVKKQRNYETMMTQMFISCNFPWNIASDPLFKQFHATFCGSGIPPSQKEMSGTIINWEVTRVEEEMIAKFRSQKLLATAQNDGWKDVSKLNLHTFMFTAQVQNQVFLFKKMCKKLLENITFPTCIFVQKWIWNYLFPCHFSDPKLT